MLRICQKYEKLIRPTLPETDIAAEIQWLEDEMSFWKLPIFRGYVSFREGSFGMVWVVIFPPESGFSLRISSVESPSFLQFLATVHEAGLKVPRGNQPPKRLCSIKD